MAKGVIRSCASCGFENAEIGRDCPLCGLPDVTLVPQADVPTLVAKGGSGADATARPEVLGGRYRIDDLLGKGGMGEVFKVRDLQTGRDLAAKLFSRESSLAAGMERFKREITVLRRLKHPSILEILDHGDEGPFAYFVTEIATGRDLRSLLREHESLPLTQAMGIAAGVADALAAAHAGGVVHRDVKPANIMIASDDSVRLLDFGLAKPEGLDVERVTRTGEFVGTPAYMSPEQFDSRTVDARSDVYSLGVVLFEMLTGHVPFSAPSVMSMAMKHLKDPIPAPSSTRADLPSWVDRLVLKCLAKEPSRRFASASALAGELRMPDTARIARPRRLRSGDSVVEPAGASSEWALVIASPGEKGGWTPGMALRTPSRTFKLERVDPPATGSGLWTYRFLTWPPGELMRRITDYDISA